MSSSEKSPERRKGFRLSMRSEIVLLALIACGFLLLHVLAGTMLLPKGSGLVAPQEKASTSSAD